VSFASSRTAKLGCTFGPFWVTASKASRKLGITIPKRSISSILLARHEAIRLALENESGSATFLALPREWIAIPSALVRELRIRHKSGIHVTLIEPLSPARRPRRFLSGQLVDLLAFVPAVNTD